MSEQLNELIDELRYTAGHLINGIIDDDGNIRSAALVEAADEIERLSARCTELFNNASDSHVEKMKFAKRALAAEARAERLRLELEKIGWMDEFLDAQGAKWMMEIARDAVNADGNA